MRKRFRDLSKSLSWLVPLLAVIAGIGFTILGKLLTWEQLFGGLVLVIVAGLAGAVTALYFARQPIAQFGDEVEDILNRLKAFQDREMTLDHYIGRVKEIIKGTLSESLITYEELMRIENDVHTNSEIWIMTSALQLETDELKEIIRNNLARKRVTYKYLIPEEERILQESFRKLAREWQRDCGLSAESAAKQIQCYLVPEHIVHMTIAIYEPLNMHSAPTVVIKFPTSSLYPEKKYPLVYRVEEEPKDAWRVFLNAFLELMRSTDGKPCPNVRRLDIDFSTSSA